MKKLFYITIAATVALSALSCQKIDHSVGQKITYYPSLSLEGAERMVVEKGTTFTEPGYYAEMQGQDVTDQVIIDNTVNMSVSGIYTITYSIVNEDGFSASASRTVIVLDSSDPVEGVWYNSATESYRLYNGNTVYYQRSYPTIIINQGNGKYYVEDFFAGWYCYRAGYGYVYQMKGHMTVDGAGNLGLIDSLIGGWNDSLESFSGNVSGNTMTWDAGYVGDQMHFVVTLTKQ